MRENIVLPDTLMEILHSPFSEERRATFRWASLDMLKELYLENPDVETVERAKLALQHAIEEWDDQRVEELLADYLFDLPLSAEIRLKSPSEQRRLLHDIYGYLFGLS